MLPPRAEMTIAVVKRELSMTSDATNIDVKNAATASSA